MIQLGTFLFRFFTLFAMGWLPVAVTLHPSLPETVSSIEGVEFFEKRIRPVLIDRCFKCHSAKSEKLEGNLHLDSRDGMLKGGDTRPALVPGDPARSLLIEAVRYTNQDLQMPPKGKLSDGQVADLVDWVTMGAPWPRESHANQSTQKGEFDLQKRRRQHWAWRSIQPQNPPVITHQRWMRNPADQFILAKLEGSRLSPAPPAEKRVLIRRLFFDLVGLPPTSHEIEEFIADHSSEAYEKVVDRLLASPRFGERWARHWLDLVRYAETLGHEFDYPVPNAWRYRDYVIRALNADVPYDQFALEHIAGDLLANPRRHPAEGFNESIIGTAFYWFGQQAHSPVDVRQYQSEVIENQIDVMTKVFLGLTVACARCHDHKFDAISTRDYYSLYGVIASSRYAQRTIDAPIVIANKIESLQKLKEKIRRALLPIWSNQARHVAEYLLATREIRLGGTKPRDAIAAEQQLDMARLDRWLKALEQSGSRSSGDPMRIWRQFATNSALASPKAYEQAWRTVVAGARHSDQAKTSSANHHTVFVDFANQDYRGWFPDGEAFGATPTAEGGWMVGDTKQPVARILSESSAHSGVISRQLQGALRSPTFTITNRYLQMLVAGRESRVNILIDNFALIQNPIYGSLRQVLDHDEFRWLTLDLGMWLGQRAYLEFSDLTTPDLAGGGKTGGYSPNGYAAVSRVLFSDDKSPPAESASGEMLSVLGDAPVADIGSLARRYQDGVLAAVNSWTLGQFSSLPERHAQTVLLDWLIQNRLLDLSLDFPADSAAGGRSSSPGKESSGQSVSQDSSEIPRTISDEADPRFGAKSGLNVVKTATEAMALIEKLVHEFQEIESSVPIPAVVPAMAEGNGLDEHVFLRGSPRSLGELVPRRFLEAIDGAEQSVFKHGSGRLELAQRITSPSNPFLARVMVNRVWHHLFGRGIVATPDDFGFLGQPPTHPELLDWLAAYYRDEAHWSTKKLIRLLVTTSTYRMSSIASDPTAEEKDPENLLLHRMPVRRLEGESIRDALLALSGRLDLAMFGPSIPMHLNEFMDGRGRPAKSGPLDGAGRRSIYVEVRRNFLSPMMRTFDTPVPFTTVGKRTVSNVPAQSLILMNDPFVLSQAQAWSKRLREDAGSSPEERITRIFLAAYGRPPSPVEKVEVLEFLKQQAKAYGLAEANHLSQEALWTDLCHVIFNGKEFVFLN